MLPGSRGGGRGGLLDAIKGTLFYFPVFTFAHLFSKLLSCNLLSFVVIGGRGGGRGGLLDGIKGARGGGRGGLLDAIKGKFTFQVHR